ncbi:universal stress protein [Sphingobacterium hungaricum]|uniref:Universal stress protein n=1 Tax=Sphingobacterium hungaricum TaxID=2082723 RepID=A0A928UWH0_9SPHI|nr:universal stress protein [Sphingobacterium hungaricum]MBE8714586.1 universal stress protein [Sphingobacterium hungaricum]
MKKLLIPIDFSENSTKALAYAAEIANESGHELDLIHIFKGHDHIYANALSGDELVDPQIGLAKRELTKLTKVLHEKYPSLITNFFFSDGNLFEEISRQTASTKYDAIIMGTKGSSGLESIFIGSNTYNVLLNTRTPVLALPISVEHVKKDKVGLLCNFKDAEIDVLKQALPLFGIDYELVLIHINADDSPIQDIDDKFKNWIDRIAKETGIDNISYVIKPKSYYIHQSDTISNSIVNVIIDEGIEVILITKSKKSIFRKMLDENIVKNMAYQINIPKFFAKVLPVTK